MINITSEEYALIDKALRKQKDFDEVEMSRYPEDSDIFQREIEIYTNLAKRLSERKWLNPGYYVPDADRNLIPIDEWLKRPDKFSAETIVYTTLTMQALGMGAIEISKKPLPCGRVNWEEAQKAAAAFRDGFRCPTRHEALDMYDNRFIGLDAALEAIGGERLEEGAWTKDEDADPRYTSTSAWFVGFGSGYADGNSKGYGFRVRAVTVLSL